MGRKLLFSRIMKLFQFLFFALSASASTLFAPLYEALAKQVISVASNALDGIKTSMSNNSQATTVIDKFQSALNGIDEATVVDILQQVPIETLLEGGLTSDDLITVFTNEVANGTFDDIDFSALSAEFTAGLDTTALNDFNEAMDAFVQATDSIQNIFSSEITIYNFVAVMTDTLDAVTRLDDVYGFMGGNMAIAQEALFWTSLLVEKGLFFMENRMEYQYMWQDAFTLIELEFDRRLQDSIDGICDDTFHFMNTMIDIAEYYQDVVLSNLEEPFDSTIDAYNTLVGNLPVVDNYQIDTNQATIIKDWIDNMAGSIKGTLVELRVLTLPFQTQIDNMAQRFIGGC